MKKYLIFLFTILNGILIVKGCNVYNKDSDNCKENNYLFFNDLELDDMRRLSSNELFNTLELIFMRINKELEKEHEKALLKSKKQLSFIENVSVDERISDYLKNNNFLTGEEIKNGVLEILKNYSKKDLNIISRIVHSETLSSDILSHGFFNLLLVPDDII